MSALKRLARIVLAHPAVASRAGVVLRNDASVFMMHRFTDPETRIGGHEPHQLRSLLRYLRRERYNLMSIGDLCEHLARGDAAPHRTVAFTIDDGYDDVFRIAAPIFAEFDCPATVFLTTGFLDRALWLWWDRVSYAFSRTAATELDVDLGFSRLHSRWHDLQSRFAAQSSVIDWLKRVPEQQKTMSVERLAASLGVEIPEQPPAAFAPLSWDAVRALGKQGFTFGPHTVTHPILTRVDTARAEWEITESWARVRSETDAHVPVFCYPNGTNESLGSKDVDLIQQAGFLAACTGQPGYLGTSHFTSRDPRVRYLLPRFSYGEFAESIQIVSGIEKLKMVIRATANRHPA